MSGVNPVVLYYDIVLALSIVLTGIYLFMWHKHFDAHITLVFVLVPLICLGYALRAHATALPEALAANKLIYLGACYLQLIVLLVIFNLGDIRAGKAGRYIKTLAFAICTVIYVYVLNPMQSGDFYRHTELEFHNGLPVLVKEYGWMHTAFEIMVVIYYLLSIATLLFCLVRKNQVSRKILGLLLFPETLAVAAFFLGKKVGGDAELLPAVYVIAQVNYLIIVARIALYDITDTAVDSLVKNGDTGFIAVDFNHHYLGSNETAKEIFPILRKLTVDLSVRKRKSFSDLVTPWLDAYQLDRSRNTADYEKDDRVYRIVISPLYNGRRERGYELTVTDNTKDRRFISLLNRTVEDKTEQLKDMYNRLIKGMADMVESRDKSTGGHIRRTSEGVKILLSEMRSWEFPELTDTFRKNLIHAAPMHDLGKITVPDAILNKPGRFTPEEYEQMKDHAANGALIVHRLLDGTEDEAFHVMAESVAQFHHERWDGKGYPDGLKGEEIPLEARIMAVADVYDALVSKRVYKERMSFEKADAIMMEGMGSQFAPEMKDVYCRARPKLEAYYLEEERIETEKEKEEAERKAKAEKEKDRTE